MRAYCLHGQAALIKRRGSAVPARQAASEPIISGLTQIGFQRKAGFGRRGRERPGIKTADRHPQARNLEPGVRLQIGLGFSCQSSLSSACPLRLYIQLLQVAGEDG